MLAPITGNGFGGDVTDTRTIPGTGITVRGRTSIQVINQGGQSPYLGGDVRYGDANSGGPGVVSLATAAARLGVPTDLPLAEPWPSGRLAEHYNRSAEALRCVPNAGVAGRNSHPLWDGAFPRRTE